MDQFLKRKFSPWVAGLLIGVIAVLVGELGGLNPPADYGLCTTCHGRDLAVGVAQKIGVLGVDVSNPVAFWPLLSTVGIIIGAGLAKRAEEKTGTSHWKPNWQQMLKSFSSGFIVMSLALLAMGCPVRMVLRTADLDVQGLIGITGVMLGVLAGVTWLKLRLSR